MILTTTQFATISNLLCTTFFFLVFFLMIRRPPRSTLFPTRRSSDLAALAHGSVLSTGCVGNRVYTDVPEDELYFVLRGAEDRKSTRLNSSHSSISYAVFCLKKKNKPYIRSIESPPLMYIYN